MLCEYMNMNMNTYLDNGRIKFQWALTKLQHHNNLIVPNIIMYAMYLKFL